MYAFAVTVLTEMENFGPDYARRVYVKRKVIQSFQHATAAPERCAFPVIAAVHGPVIGMGCDIISACDVRYAASNATFCIKVSSIRWSLGARHLTHTYKQEVDVGLAADVGTLAHLPKITSNNSLARELAYTARSFSAVEAYKLGFVSKVVDGGQEEVVKAALELANSIAKKSPVAVAGTKRLLLHSRDHSYVVHLLSSFSDP
jgi:delta(3,5)-delta(2,4)-dienoyl-CoA isomerase